MAEASAEPRETRTIDPDLWARRKAEQTARIQADREAEAEKMARLTPVTDAELERYGGRLDPELSPEVARELAELRQALRGEHHAERAGQAEALARLIPVTDAEVAKYGGVRPGDGPRPDLETLGRGGEDSPGRAPPCRAGSRSRPDGAPRPGH